MNFSKAYAPEMFASTDLCRTALTHLHLDTKAKTLTACDGHRMIIVPCEVDEGDTTGPVPVAAVKLARKIAGKNAPIVTVKANVSIVLTDGTTMPRPDCGKYPDVSQVVPRDDDFSEGKTACFNWRYLADAQKALNAGDALNLMINNNPKSACMVKDGAGAIVVVMPTRP